MTTVSPLPEHLAAPESIEERLARAEALVVELRGQRNDAVAVALQAKTTIDDCRRAVRSRDILVARLLEQIVDCRMRISTLEGLRDINTRVIDRLRGALPARPVAEERG